MSLKKKTLSFQNLPRSCPSQRHGHFSNCSLLTWKREINQSCLLIWGLPFNIYLFNESTARFKSRIRWGERSRRHPTAAFVGTVPPSWPVRPRKWTVAMSFPHTSEIKARLDSIKLAPVREICLTKPWKLLWTCAHWFCCQSLRSFDEKAVSTRRWKGFTSSVLKRED